MPEYQLGFADYVATHPEVGDPLTDEYPISSHYNVQETTGGLLVYQVSSNQIDFAEFASMTEPPVPPADVRDAIMTAAESYLGVRYGMPPGPGQFDCSSYVLQVYADAGLPFKGVRTAEQIRQQCAPIAWDEVQPGDLLFFVETYQVSEPPGPDGYAASHVGISYGVGTFRMINAVEPAVQITAIDTDFWQTHLQSAGRHPDIAAAPPDSAPVPGNVAAVDISNYQEWGCAPETLSAYLATLDPVPTRVIVRLASYLEPAHLRATAIAQLRAASALYPGTVQSLGCYGWCYVQANPQREVDYWHAQIMEAQPAPLHDFWLDVEDEENCPTEGQLLAELDLLDGLGYEPGIYTGKPFWEAHFGRCDAAMFLYPVWIANYSTAYTIDTVPIPAGWDEAQGWQYSATPCDRDVFRA